MPVTSAAPVRYCYRVSVSEGYFTTPRVTLGVGERLCELEAEKIHLK